MVNKAQVMGRKRDADEIGMENGIRYWILGNTRLDFKMVEQMIFGKKYHCHEPLIPDQ